MGDRDIACEVPRVIQYIVERPRVGCQPQKILLFGSYAYGTSDQASDIELLIIKETPDRFLNRWVEVQQILSDSQRMIPLETLILTSQEVSDRLARGDQFLAEVLEKGRVLYAAL